MNLLLYWLRDAWARLTRTLDWPLCLALGALMGIGLAVLYSAGNESLDLVLKQGVRYAFGIAAMWALSRLPIDAVPDVMLPRCACLLDMLIEPVGAERPVSVPAGPFSTSMRSMLNTSRETEPRSRMPSTKMLPEVSNPRM